MTEQVLITGAGRDTGRLLALAFAARGAHVYVNARTTSAAEETVALIEKAGGTAEPLVADLNDLPDLVNRSTDRLDVLVNNAARYLQGDVTDEAVSDTLASGTATVLLTERLLPVLRKSPHPDIVNVISAVADPGHRRSEAHAAFYAAKHAHAGYAEILSHRLRPEGIRVISLYPPDFVQDGPRETGADLTAQSVVDCVLFAVSQPRDCFIKAFHFEQVVSG